MTDELKRLDLAFRGLSDEEEKVGDEDLEDEEEVDEASLDEEKPDDGLGGEER